MTRGPNIGRQLNRGDVWWVVLDPTIGGEIRKTRPAIVLSADPINRVRSTVVVVPLSSAAQPRAPIVTSMPSAGPSSVAVCDQLRAVDRSRLTTRIGAISPADLRLLEHSVRAVLAL